MRPWHPQLGFLPEDEPELAPAIEEPGPIEHPEPEVPARVENALRRPIGLPPPGEPQLYRPPQGAEPTYLGWLVDDETGALRPPGAPAPAPSVPAASAPAPEAPKGATDVRGALRDVVVAGLRRLARAIDR